MELTHEFSIDRPLTETWPVLVDLRAVAAALPGASIEDVTADGTHIGALRVSLGAFRATFRGEARHTLRDDEDHTFELEASGRSPQGNAGLRMTGKAVERDGVTHVQLTSSVQLTGRLAQFGGAMASEVARPMLDSFVANFTEGFKGTEESTGSAGAAQPSADQPTPSGWQGRSADTLDLGAGLLPAPAKYLAIAGAAAFGVLIGMLIPRRRRMSRPLVVLVTSAREISSH